MADNETILKKHSVVIAGHQTSVTLENIFWENLKKIAYSKGESLKKIITEIDGDRKTNLSSAIRVYVLKNINS